MDAPQKFVLVAHESHYVLVLRAPATSPRKAIPRRHHGNPQAGPGTVRGYCQMWTLIWVLTAISNDQYDGKKPTDRLIPETWQVNPWGPEAARARLSGEIPPIVLTPQMKRWDAWGKTVLRDGDLLFRQAHAKLLLGGFPFGRFLARVSGGRFSHTGIAAIENGEPV